MEKIVIGHKPSFSPPTEIYYHTITKQDTQQSLALYSYTPKGKPVGSAIMQCIGRLVPNDVGRTLKITISGSHTHCQLSQYKSQIKAKR